MLHIATNVFQVGCEMEETRFILNVKGTAILAEGRRQFRGLNPSVIVKMWSIIRQIVKKERF